MFLFIYLQGMHKPCHTRLFYSKSLINMQQAQQVYVGRICCKTASGHKSNRYMIISNRFYRDNKSIESWLIWESRSYSSMWADQVFSLSSLFVCGLIGLCSSLVWVGLNSKMKGSKHTCTDACFSRRSDWCGLQGVRSLILAARYAANWGVNNCMQSSEISTAALWSARSYWNGSICRYQWLCLIGSRAFRHKQAATAAAMQSNADMLQNQAFGILILKCVHFILFLNCDRIFFF